MIEHTFIVRNIISVRNIVTLIVRIPSQHVRPNTYCDVLKQEVYRCDSPIDVTGTTIPDVAPLELIAVRAIENAGQLLGHPDN